MALHRSLQVSVWIVVTSVACATTQRVDNGPKTRAEVDRYLSEWMPVHRLAVLRRAKSVLQCDDITLQFLSAGRRSTGPEYGGGSTQIATAWAGVGCGRDGSWSVGCPPLETMASVDVKSGQVACEVTQLAAHNKEAPGLYVMTAPGEIIVVDRPVATAPEPSRAPEDQPED